MIISNSFNRFLHGVIYKEVKQIKSGLKVHDKFIFRPSSLSLDSVKQLLKYLDLNYPRDEKQVPKSITKLDNKQICLHIEWIIKLLANNGLTMPHIDEEWERLMESVRNE